MYVFSASGKTSQGAAGVPGFRAGLSYSNSTVALPLPGTIASRVDMVPSGA